MNAKQLKALVAKHQSGQTLTDDEQDAIRQAAQARHAVTPPALRGIAGTVAMMSREFGVSRRTLLRRLTDAGQTGSRFTIRQCHEALASKADDQGNIHEARLKKLREETALLALERQKTEGDLVPMAEVKEMLSGWLAPIRSQFLSLPAAMASRCNPGDPEIARQALEDWMENAMKLCRDTPATVLDA